MSQEAKKLVCTRCAGPPRRVEKRTALLSSSEDEKLGCGHVEHIRIVIGPEAMEIRLFRPKAGCGVVGVWDSGFMVQGLVLRVRV